MIDRGTIARGFMVLLLLAAACAGLYAVMAHPGGSSGNFLEDDDQGWHYGPVYEQRDGWENTVLADPWLRRVPVSGGTFGSTYNRQVRIGITGSGPIPEREATLETPAAIDLFAGARRERAEDVLHGIERILEEQGGLVRGISMAPTRGGIEAAAMSSVIRERTVDDFGDAQSRALITSYLDVVSKELAGHAYAWYDPRYEEIVFGPVITNGLTMWIRTPKQATQKANIFTAYVLRHELEHAVTPLGDAPGAADVQWIEEGTADTIARWAGAAATTASELGMPYPKRYEDREYSTSRGGYPEWTDALRILLGAAGADWRRPGDLDEASELLQSKDATHVPELLADRIAKRERLTKVERATLERGIRALDGDPAAARRLVARY
ncbi:MAG: hypothetical protein KDC46_09575 [Thermoleophilia bacterium]|nr:hypothetical protein [Thermoleophilia bacterium]